MAEKLSLARKCCWSAFASRASGHCYVSREINRFSKSFRVANIKNAGFSNSRLGFRLSKLDLFKARVLFWFCLFIQRSLSLPDLSRKIKGSPLAGCKYLLINNNFFKDRSFMRYLVLDILTNPVRVTLTKKVTFCRKIHCQFRCLYIKILAPCLDVIMIAFF